MPNDAGTAYIDVEPELRGFGPKLSRGIDPHVNKSAKNVESRFGAAFKGAAVAATGAFAALGAVSVFKDLIGGASDLNETISKSNTIFGSQGKEIEKWAGTAAKAFGQSKQGALDAAATFGNLFVQLGTGTKEAAKMSTQMVELASDFASFHNADPTDVIESMTAAFRGEYDAVQRYVPTINAAAVEQEALKLGLAKTTKELTAQDKALATQSLLLKGAGAAAGDFARTSDGLANRQRILAAQFQDTKDKIGTALLPVVLKAMETFLAWGAALSGPVKRGLEVVGPIFTRLVDSVKLFFGAITGAGANVDVGGWMNPIIDAAAKVRQVFDSVVKWVRDNWPEIGAVFKSAVGVIEGAIELAKPVLEVFGRVAADVFKALSDNLPALKLGLDGVAAAFRGIGGFINDHLEGFKQLAEVIGVVMVARLVALQVQALITFGSSTIAAITGYTAATTAAGTATTAMGAASLGVLGPAALLTGAIVLLTRTTADHIPAVNGFLDRLFTLEEMIPGVGDKLGALDRAVFGVGKTSDDTAGRVQTLHERLLNYARGYEATVTIDASQAYRTLDELRSELSTINANIERSGPGGGNRAAANDIEERIAERESSEEDAGASQEFARGMEKGPVKGRPNERVPIIAHGGEWVLTQEQLDGLRSGRSGGSSAPVAPPAIGAGIDYDRLAAAMSRVQLRVGVSNVAKGMDRMEKRNR